MWSAKTFICRSDFKLIRIFEMVGKWKMVKNRLNGKIKFSFDLEHARNMSNLWRLWFGNYAATIKSTIKRLTKLCNKKIPRQVVIFRTDWSLAYAFLYREGSNRLCLVLSFRESVDMTSSKEMDLEFNFKCVGDKCIPQILHKYQEVMGFRISSGLIIQYREMHRNCNS